MPDEQQNDLLTGIDVSEPTSLTDVYGLQLPLLVWGHVLGAIGVKVEKGFMMSYNWSTTFAGTHYQVRAGGDLASVQLYIEPRTDRSTSIAHRQDMLRAKISDAKAVRLDPTAAEDKEEQKRIRDLQKKNAAEIKDLDKELEELEIERLIIHESIKRYHFDVAEWASANGCTVNLVRAEDGNS
jgi:hypothetical protein